MPRSMTVPAGLFIFGVLAATASAEPLSTERESGLKAGATFSECEQCPQMVVVPAGSFSMGSPAQEVGRNSWEHPQHLVSIAAPFAVGKFEVTVDQFGAYVRESGRRPAESCWTYEKNKVDLRGSRSWRDPAFAQEGSHPVVCVSWEDAQGYLGWLAKKTGKPYRLLSEAEWEYAARAASTPEEATRFGFGDNEDALCAHANGFDQTAKKTVPGTTVWPALSCFDNYAYTSPVGSFAANAFGLHDMLGNAKEWTTDCFLDGQGYRGVPSDGSAFTASGCHMRVLRGGSWMSYARLLRVAFRYKNPPNEHFGDAGFRVARALVAH
ncbi:MAG: formylglycine-generating enzyme family protein [Xanthobacteraceae bacterium]